MKNIRYCSFPSTPAEALSGLLNRKAESIAVAGGTLTAKTLPETISGVVDLKRLPLSYIKKSGTDLVIGATATFDEIDNSRLARNWAGGVLAQAAARGSSQLIRNMATIGGNIARPHSFNIFPVVLLGLDAHVKILSKKGVSKIAFADIYGPDFKLKPGRDCLILEVVIPGKTRKWICRFEKFAKTEGSWEAYFSLFMAAEIKRGHVSQARVSVGALTPKPFRALSAERALSRVKLYGGSIEAAAAALKLDMEAVHPGDFKKAAAAGLLSRFFSEAARAHN